MDARDFLEALADAVTSKRSQQVSCKSSKSDVVVGNQCGDRRDEDTAAADVDPGETSIEAPPWLMFRHLITQAKNKQKVTPP